MLKEFNEWLKTNTVLKSNSRTQYVLQIKKFLDNYNEITLDNIRRFLLLQKVDRYVYIRKFAIKYFLKSIVKDEWNEELKPIYKTIKLKDRRYNRYISNFGKFKVFLDSLSIELKTILMLSYDTALRISPIINLKVNDIDRDEDGYFVEVIEKGGKRVKRYFDNKTAELLSSITNNKNSNDYVFRNKNETWWKCYYRYWKELKNKSRKTKLVGDFGVSFHWIRTTRAIKFYKKYKDLMKVKNLLGHKSIQTTQRYVEEGEIESARVIKEESGKWD
jgi:integrase